jgi:hypothetical protein
MLPIGSNSRRLLNQSTHSSVAYSTVSNDRHDLGLEQADTTTDCVQQLFPMERHAP